MATKNHARFFGVARFCRFCVAVHKPSYTQALSAEHMGMGIGAAVERVLSDNIAELTRQTRDGHTQEHLDTLVETTGRPQGGRLWTEQATNAREELDELLPRHAAYLEILKLIVNSLVYLSAYPDDIERKWPADGFLL